jgi:hypothetical protein
MIQMYRKVKEKKEMKGEKERRNHLPMTVNLPPKKLLVT